MVHDSVIWDCVNNFATHRERQLFLRASDRRCTSDVVKVEHSENVANEIVHAALKGVLCTLEIGEEVVFVFGEDRGRGRRVQVVENDGRNIGWSLLEGAGPR
ncbi:hypothetical protein M378DRAFT_867045 [Amanita muscaria Koide BX008]|uniref:Uncharacterized protein n=1 Tax=Amanita muscaria (strain Koide BX008) TaxID=946122 RepID=A0A0C2WWF2_AMAMK|nr:hypothetical protein M378DRAFT_867045 [Amanita muscaria Koide BX008]